MKIAVDANEAFRKELTGIGVYARHLVQQLSRIQTGHEIVFLGMQSDEKRTRFLNHSSLRLLRSLPYRSVWSQLRLPVHLTLNRYDLFHSLDHKLPRIDTCKSVVTLYDLGFAKFPDSAERIHRERFLWFTRDAVSRASKLIAISRSTKNDVCGYFNIPESKVDVVFLGVDNTIYNEAVPPTRRSKPYVLAVGTLQPRKNYGMLFSAFRKLCDMSLEPIELLIVGKRGWLWEGIEKDARQGKHADRIHFLGYVPDIEMPGLYSGATMVVMPSLYEGFGIPLLEAMACGTPVISSNVSSLPEVVGDAGILLSPNDETSWTEAMLSLVKNREQCSELRNSGLKRAREFSWERTAQETLEVYRKTLMDLM